MRTDRRSAILGALALTANARVLASCGASGRADTPKTKLHVIGTIHSRHRTSPTYPLERLRDAIVAADPDIVLTEIPPDRIGKAIQSFQETGQVDEPRTQVFPEYTDVLFPLMDKMRFEVVGTAGWTRAIADERRAALNRISESPARQAQWNEHRAALRDFSRKLAGRGDDPVFIHTDEFDDLVAQSREPYARYFDQDLGAGGWTQINAAHTALINAALDRISGQGLTALVTFGTAHKYKILESVADRADVELLDTRALFL